MDNLNYVVAKSVQHGGYITTPHATMLFSEAPMSTSTHAADAATNDFSSILSEYRQ